jgi:hydrogenase maturation protease
MTNDVGGRILVLGYGNPGRRDDGLGPAFAEAIGKMNLPGVTAEAGYQLDIEDAAALAGCDAVLFVDAVKKGARAFTLERIHPELSTSFTSHHVRPSFVLAVAREVFDAEPMGYLLAIRGYELNDLEEGLSKGARANLEAALDVMVPALERGSLPKVTCGNPIDCEV